MVNMLWRKQTRACKHPPAFTVRNMLASSLLPRDVRPVASLLSPKRDLHFYSAVSSSSSSLGLNLQSFHLPSSNANPCRDPESWLFTVSLLFLLSLAKTPVN